MTTKLFVARLSFGTTNDSLKALFAQHGTVVSAQVVTDRDSERSKGFGFVEMSDAATAKAAIDALDGSDFEGRQIAVSMAKPREDRDSRGFNSGFQRR